MCDGVDHRVTVTDAVGPLFWGLERCGADLNGVISSRFARPNGKHNLLRSSEILAESRRSRDLLILSSQIKPLLFV
jgi:hypothetical protein